MGTMPRQCTTTAPEGKGRGWEIGEQGIRPFGQRSGIRAADRLGAVCGRGVCVLHAAVCCPVPSCPLIRLLILPASDHPLS